MHDEGPLATWGYGLVVAGGVLMAVATVTGFVARGFVVAGGSLPGGTLEELADHWLTGNRSPLAGAAWGLATSAAALVAGSKLRPDRGEGASGWAGCCWRCLEPLRACR